MRHRTRNTIWFWVSFAGAIGNGIWFEICAFYGITNWFALGVFLLCFAHAVHYANLHR